MRDFEKECMAAAKKTGDRLYMDVAHRISTLERMIEYFEEQLKVELQWADNPVARNTFSRVQKLLDVAKKVHT